MMNVKLSSNVVSDGLIGSVKSQFRTLTVAALTCGLLLGPVLLAEGAETQNSDQTAPSSSPASSVGGDEVQWEATETPAPTQEIATTGEPSDSSEQPTESEEAVESSAPSDKDEATSTLQPSEKPGEEDPAASDASISPMLVPDPGPNTAVITVKVGGDRSASGAVGPLAGVKLGLYGAGTATTGGGSGGNPEIATQLPVQGVAGARYSEAWSWTTCVSDADGDCSFIIPIRDGVPSDTGVPEDTRFWVAQESSPAGWYSNPILRIGAFGASPDGSWQYRFRTDTTLRAGMTYRSTDPMPWNETNDAAPVASGNPDRYFMRNRVDTNIEGWYASNVTRTTGVWNQSRSNPELPAQCGLDVALITDTSGSLGAAGMSAMKSTMDAFADAFRGTDSRMAAFSFANRSPSSTAMGNYPNLLPVTTATQADQFKAQYASWSSGGGTNWDEGFAAAANSSANYDIAILLTDGNPTVIRNNPGTGSSAYNSLQDTDAGVFSANQLKAKGTHVIALGIGQALTTNSEYNLRAVSGPEKGSDYLRVGNFQEATAALVALAKQNCSGSIEVQKLIVPEDGTIQDATPAPEGWKFDASPIDNEVTIEDPASKTTGANDEGRVDFGLDFEPPATSGRVQILETQQEGYEIFPVGEGTDARNAVCTVLDTDEVVPVENAGDGQQPGFTVTSLRDERVSCKIYNRILKPGKLEVSKMSNPESGTTVAPGQVVSYTLRFENTGERNISVDHEDVLTDVLDDADLLGDPVAESPLSADLNAAGNRIHITGELEPGESKTVTYQVKIKDPLSENSNAVLGNFVVGTGGNPPETCEPDEPCTVHPIKVGLSWNKVDLSGNALKGSEWSLIPVDSSGVPMPDEGFAVEDCTAGETSECTGPDTDPGAGVFSLKDLVPGKYMLVETKAPAGYQLLEEAIELTVNTNLDFGDIENEQSDVPTIPLTGGIGSYLFTGAALACVAAVIVAVLFQRRRAGSQS